MAASQRRLKAENNALRRELAGLHDDRGLLQRWLRHRDGTLKRRWPALAVLIGATAGAAGTYYWWFGERASTAFGRAAIRLTVWLRSSKDHVAAMGDDMVVMGPFIHAAAEVVRLAYSQAGFGAAAPAAPMDAGAGQPPKAGPAIVLC